MGVVIDNARHESESLRVDRLSRRVLDPWIAELDDHSVTNADITPLRRVAHAVVHLSIPNFQVKHVPSSDRCSFGIVTICCLFPLLFVIP